MTAPARPDRPFWTVGVEQALADSGASAHGLSSIEAAARLRRFGPNELAPPRRFEALREIAHFFADPLVLILLVASGVSAAFGQVSSSVVIALMLVRSGFLILQIVVFLVLFVFLVNALFRRDPLESFLFAVALAVGLTPELLPMSWSSPNLGLVEVVKRWFYRRYPM